MQRKYLDVYGKFRKDSFLSSTDSVFDLPQNLNNSSERKIL